jgi:hypothetical protein
MFALRMYKLQAATASSLYYPWVCKKTLDIIRTGTTLTIGFCLVAMTTRKINTIYLSSFFIENAII